MRQLRRSVDEIQGFKSWDNPCAMRQLLDDVGSVSDRHDSDVCFNGCMSLSDLQNRKLVRG